MNRLPISPMAVVLAALALNAADVAVIPPPREMTTEHGSVPLAFPVRIAAPARQVSAAEAISGEIKLNGGTAVIAAGQGSGPAILLGTPGEAAIDRALAATGLTVPEQPESYVLHIGPRGVLAAGRDDAGVFYAAQTLRQLMRAHPGGDAVVLPQFTIRDWPQMPFRGLSVDLGQGAVPTEEQMRRIIETCAEYKLNVVSFYMQHLVAFRSTPLLAPPGAELDAATLGRLADFAARRHVTLLPQQQTFGHLHHLLKHELYSSLGEVPHGTTLNAGAPAVYDWVEGAVDELAAALPGRFFHAGGDETWDLGKGANREAVAAGGEGKLWVEHMTRVAELLRRRNRRMLFWGDVVLKSPGLIAQMPRDAVAATWAYNADSRFADSIAPFRKAGLDVVVCPSVNNWSKPAPDFNVAVANIGRFVAEGKRQNAMGMLNTVWFDDGESLFDVTWYPVLYSTAAAWRGEDVPRAQFDAAYDWAFHRATGDAFAGAIRKLGEVHEAMRRAGLADAANEYLWLDPYTGRGARVYARVEPFARQLRLAAEEALTAIRQNRVHSRLHTGTLDFLEFAARRMDWFGMKVQFAAEIAALYRDAREHTGDTRRVNYDLLQISDINGRMQDLRDAAGEMKEQYRRLWLSVNRPYLLNGMLGLYDREVLYWLDKAARMAEVRAAWRQSRTLAEPGAAGLGER